MSESGNEDDSTQKNVISIIPFIWKKVNSFLTKYPPLKGKGYEQ